MEDATSSQSERLPRLSEEQIDRKFKTYIQALDLTDKDLAEGKSICVIGAGSNVFAAGLKRAHPDGKHAFVMGVDPVEKRYHQLDPAIINHDARDLGFPVDFEEFDLVISMHAVPKYFVMWSAPKQEKEHVISKGISAFDYSIGERDGTKEEAAEATYQALSEMLRITKPGGKIRLYPVSIARSGIPTYELGLVVDAVERLAKTYPKIDMLIGADEETSLPGLPSPPRGPFVEATIEIVKPRKKSRRV